MLEISGGIGLPLGPASGYKEGTFFSEPKEINNSQNRTFQSNQKTVLESIFFTYLLIVLGVTVIIAQQIRYLKRSKKWFDFSSKFMSKGQKLLW